MRGPKTTLTLERLTQTQNAIGGYDDTWTTVKAIVGVLNIATGHERVIRNKIQVVVSHNFFYDPVIGVTATELDRFVIGTRLFEILHVERPMNTERGVICRLQEQT